MLDDRLLAVIILGPLCGLLFGLIPALLSPRATWRTMLASVLISIGFAATAAALTIKEDTIFDTVARAIVAAMFGGLLYEITRHQLLKRLNGNGNGK